MSFKYLVAIACAFQLVDASRLGWDIPSCNTAPHLEGNTLKMELVCENEFPGIDSLFFYFLYPTAADGRCQWDEFSRQYSTLCETSHASPQKHIQATFEHVYKGSYCLAVYRKKWTTSLPICSINVPFYLETELTEMDVKMWSPTITLQQQGFKYYMKLGKGKSYKLTYESPTSDLFIQLDNNHIDGYNFSEFDIEIHAVDESITHCDLLPVMSQTKTITVSIYGKSLILSNLTEGDYCVQVTPVDVRCIHPHSSTNLPCTRSSNTTRITFPRGGDYQKIVVTGSVTVFLVSCLMATVIFLKKHNEAKKRKCRDKIPIGLMSPVAIFLLHSNEERLRSSVKMLKDALHARLSSCEIDDHTDEHQWENVAQEGISWFLSRLNQKEKYIIVIAPFLDGNLIHQREFGENYYFPFALQQLQSIASSTTYQRILIVWFQYDSKVECVPFRRFGNPFTNFLIPKDLDRLAQHIRNLDNQDYV